MPSFLRWVWVCTKLKLLSLCCFKFSAPLAHNEALFAPTLSIVHLLHQINRRWERLVLNDCSSLFSCIWQGEQRQRGLILAPELLWHFFACRALVVGESSLLPGAADRPVSPQNTQEHTHGHVFLTGCFKGSPELFDQVLQSLFTAFLLAALTVAFITGYFIWVREEHAHGFQSTQCSYK